MAGIFRRRGDRRILTLTQYPSQCERSASRLQSTRVIIQQLCDYLNDIIGDK